MNWIPEWLVKTDDEHYKEDWDENICNICGKKERFFLKIDFSFCDEYSCGIQICSKCLKEFQRIFKDGVKEKMIGGGQHD